MRSSLACRGPWNPSSLLFAFFFLLLLLCCFGVENEKIVAQATFLCSGCDRLVSCILGHEIANFRSFRPATRMNGKLHFPIAGWRQRARRVASFSFSPKGRRRRRRQSPVISLLTLLSRGRSHVVVQAMPLQNVNPKDLGFFGWIAATVEASYIEAGEGTLVRAFVIFSHPLFPNPNLQSLVLALVCSSPYHIYIHFSASRGRACHVIKPAMPCHSPWCESVERKREKERERARLCVLRKKVVRNGWVPVRSFFAHRNEPMDGFGFSTALQHFPALAGGFSVCLCVCGDRELTKRGTRSMDGGVERFFLGRNCWPSAEARRVGVYKICFRIF